jgi:hypothetical protein
VGVRSSPHPRAPYGRGVGFEDAADDSAIGQHVEVILIPLPGRARGRGAFEDEVHSGTSRKAWPLVGLNLLLLLHGGLWRPRLRERRRGLVVLPTLITTTRPTAARGRDGGWSELAFFLAKVQAIHDGRFRPAGQALKVSDHRVDFFLAQPPALCFLP